MKMSLSGGKMVSRLAWLRDYDGEPLPRENSRAALGT